MEKPDLKFSVVGNMNAVTYKEIFPLVKDNLVWYGPSISSGDREFRVPESYPLEAAGYRIDDDGSKYIRVKGVRWFTNIDHGRRHDPLPLMTMEDNIHFNKAISKLDSPYPKYDNYDAIEVPITAAIPSDYTGVMGVPISFLDKYSPEQFNILGSDYQVKEGELKYLIRRGWDGKLDRGYVNGKRIYSRLLIQHKRTVKED